MGVVKMFKKIDHVEIIPQDIEKTIKFYTELLGFELKHRQKVEAGPLQEVIYLVLNGTTIELLSVKEPKPISQEQWQVGYRGIALEVGDMDKAVEYLKDKGIEITWGPIDLGNSIRAEIKDINNLPIELRQWK